MTFEITRAAIQARPLAAGMIAPAATRAKRPFAFAQTGNKAMAQKVLGDSTGSVSLRDAAMLAAKARFQARAIAGEAKPAPQIPETPATPPAANEPLLGDVNLDGRVDRSDTLDLAKYLFLEGELPGMANADVNQDGAVNLGDIVKLTQMLTVQEGQLALPPSEETT